MRHARRTWCMTSSYWKTSVFVRPHVNEKPAFLKISTLENVFEKMHFRWQFSPNTYEWTVGQTGKKISVNSNKTEINVDRALVVPYWRQLFKRWITLSWINHYTVDRIVIYPVDSVDPPFEQPVLRSLWIFIRSSKDACADLQGPLKILKSFSPGSAIAIQRLNNWGQKYMLIPRCFCFACLFVFFIRVTTNDHNKSNTWK